MYIRRKIRKLINNNDKLYALEKTIRNFNDKKLIKLINCYYRGDSEYALLIINHNGTKYPDQIIYYIPYWWENTCITTDIGFCAALRRLLELLYFSDHFHLTPVIYWGIFSAYYDHGMDAVTDNAYEYYFEPVSNVDYRLIKECRNVIEAGRNGRFFMNDQTPYSVSQDEIELLASIFEKYIHLNERTKEYVDKNVNNILKYGKVLGVHVRGTDYLRLEMNLPKPITVEEFVTAVRSADIQDKYDKIFLATDDANVLEAFRNEFKDRLLFYADAFRSDNHNGAHCTFSDRPLHRYKLGLELLRDIYTLANCNSLVCGLSQVSFAARYVNLAIRKKFTEVVIIDHGVNKEHGPEAQVYFKQRRKYWRKNKHDVLQNL